jgi:hypothetical protein
MYFVHFRLICHWGSFSSAKNVDNYRYCGTGIREKIGINIYRSQMVQQFRNQIPGTATGTGTVRIFEGKNLKPSDFLLNISRIRITGSDTPGRYLLKKCAIFIFVQNSFLPAAQSSISEISPPLASFWPSSSLRLLTSTRTGWKEVTIIRYHF